MSSMRLVTVVQARTGSSRLPNKIMLPLAGKPLLARLVERVQAAGLAGTVVVATTWEPADDPIAALCRAEGLACFRGHPTDLLDRHYQAGQLFQADAVVKIPSDVPLIDPKIIDRVIGLYLQEPGVYDYVSNLHPASYPDGNDVEIMAMPALETAWREAQRDYEREHTTPFFWENPERFCIGNVVWESGLDYSMSHRWTIDYEQDYRFIKVVFHTLYPQNQLFGLEDILVLLERRPYLMALNSQYAGVNWYRHHLDELRTVSVAHTRLEPAQEAHVG
ncbi:MAG: cytidylyltransferase domain-containing protein [Chloroflexota bacterium]